MWIGIAVVLILIGVVSYSFRFKDIEIPKYKVLKTIGKVEIREYPSMIMARTSLTSNEYKSSGNNGFRTVASYIFGGNSKQQKIAMTAPVIMNMGDSASMSFVMPSEYQRQDLPEPSNNLVRLVEQSPKVLAVLRFGGFSDDEKIKRYADALRNILIENNIQIVGPLQFMGYNAPWDMINRRNEVAFEVAGYN